MILQYLNNTEHLFIESKLRDCDSAWYPGTICGSLKVRNQHL